MVHDRLIAAALFIPLTFVACGKKEPSAPTPAPAPAAAKTPALVADLGNQSRAALDAAKARVAALEAQLGGLKTDLAARQKELADKTAALGALQKQAEEAAASAKAAAEAKVTQTQSTCDAAIAKVKAEGAAAIAPLQQKLDEYDKQIKDLEASPLGGLAGGVSGKVQEKIAQLKATRDGVAKQITDWEKKTSDSIAGLKAKCSEEITAAQVPAPGATTQTQAQIQAATDESAKLTQAIGTLEQSTQSTQTQLDAAKGEVSKLEQATAAPLAGTAPAKN